MARFPDSPNVLKVLPGPIRTARTSEKMGPFADVDIKTIFLYNILKEKVYIYITKDS